MKDLEKKKGLKSSSEFWDDINTKDSKYKNAIIIKAERHYED